MSGFFGQKTREDELAMALAQELQTLTTGEPSSEVVATPEAEVKDALASVIATLVKCATSLEAVGHPSVERVDNLLAMIEKDFFTDKTNVQ